VSVGEVFEVMTQVDHALTLVNQFDRQLRLIKNLGRHTGLASCLRAPLVSRKHLDS
jgi:hypothetical protein